jgi:hypothetical protein
VQLTLSSAPVAHLLTIQQVPDALDSSIGGMHNTGDSRRGVVDTRAAVAEDAVVTSDVLKEVSVLLRYSTTCCVHV